MKLSGTAQHPSREALDRFVGGDLERAEARGVVRHLLARCPECLQATRQLWRLGDPAVARFSSAATEGAFHGCRPPGRLSILD